MSKSVNVFFVLLISMIALTKFGEDVYSRISFARTGIELPAYPRPAYSTMHVPGPDVAVQSAATKGPVGGDFSQVYFSAKALRSGQSAYTPQDPTLRDRFGRLPNYPPLVNWLYKPLAALFYPDALLLHTGLTLSIFLGVCGTISFRTGIFHHFWKVLVTCLLLFFYTPLGYTHFERGQFDFYTALAFMLLSAVMQVGHSGWSYAVLAGLFGALKWSSLPLLGAVSAFGFLFDLPRKRWVYVIPLAVVSLSILLFWRQFLEYIPSLQLYEFSSKESMGLSFGHFMPKPLAKSFQILCAVLFSGVYFFYSRKQNPRTLFIRVAFPFALVMAVQSVCFGAISFEYRVVSLLGMIVPFVLWAEKSDVSAKVKITMAVSLAVFLAFVFRNFQSLIRPDEVHMTVVFLASSLFWLGLCCYIVVKGAYLRTSTVKF